MNTHETEAGSSGDSLSVFEHPFVVEEFFQSESSVTILNSVLNDLADLVSVVVVTGKPGIGKSALYSVIQHHQIADRLTISLIILLRVLKM